MLTYENWRIKLRSEQGKDMNHIKLSQEAQADILIHVNVIGQLSDQIKALESQRAANVKAANYIWKSEYFRDMLNGEACRAAFPELIDKAGNINVNIEDGIASWNPDDNVPPLAIERKES